MLIMTLATKSYASISASVTRVAALAIAPVISLGRAVINRREVLRLTELDERALKDIGLLRGDVEGALATSWLTDPSAVLAARNGSAAQVATARRAGAELPSGKPARAVSRDAAKDSEQPVACCA